MKMHGNSGKNNHNYGKHLPLSVRKKIAKAHYRGGWKNHLPHCADCGKKLASYYAKRCQKCASKGINNSNYKHGKHCIEHYCLICHKIIDKNGRSLRCPKHAHIGKLGSMYGKTPSPKTSYGKRMKYKKIIFRSSYEYLFAKYLDKNNVKWLYEPKAFDLGNTTYTPDFYLPEKDLYIEIKGYWRINAKIKFFTSSATHILVILIFYVIAKDHFLKKEI